MATSTTPPQLDSGRQRDPERVPRRVGFSQTLGRWDVKVSPYLYISPFFLLFALTGLFPLAYTAYVSVHDWHLIGGKGDFVGFENYLFVVQEPNFWKSLRNTFSIFILSTVPQLTIAIVLAALLDANLRARTFWRMGVLLPYVVAPVAVSLIFGKLFAEKSGLINTVLGNIGIDPIAWQAQVLPSHIAIATMVDFRWTGYNTLILLAAMQAIPKDLYEAAVLDGASRVPPVLLGHRPDAAPDDHLRGHHVDHRWPADLRRAAPVRPDRPGWPEPPVDDGDHVHLRARVG